MRLTKHLPVLLALVPAACVRNYTFDRDSQSSDDAADVATADVTGDTPMADATDAPMVDAGPAPLAPRLIGPISGSRIAGRPSVSVAAPGSALDHVRVEICSDPACAMVIGTSDSPAVASGATTTFALTIPTASNVAGPLFWRAKSVSALGRESTPTNVWVMYRTHVNAMNAGYVGMAMDMDRDGLPDFATGEPAPRTSMAAGAVDIIRGSAATVIDPTPIHMLNTMSAFHLGENVANIGDVNGDGFTDLFVIADSPDPSFAGRYLYLVLGAATLTSLSFHMLSPTMAATFGQTIAPIGDIDGDGYGDVAVSYRFTTGVTTQVSIFRGSPDGIATGTGTITSPYTDGVSDGFGQNIFSVGDLNHDGLSDFVLFSPSHAPYDAYIYNGRRTITGTWTSSATIPAGGRSGFGATVAGGDLSGRGEVDFVIRDGTGAVTAFSPQGTGTTPYVSIGPVATPPNSTWGQALAILDHEGTDAVASYVAASELVMQQIDLYACGASGCTSPAMYMLAPASAGFGFAMVGMPAPGSSYTIDALVASNGTDTSGLYRVAVFTPPGTSACSGCSVHGTTVEDAFGALLTSMH